MLYLQNNAGKRKLRITLLSIEWKTSSNGELTTINRELAIQMAKHPSAEVSVFVPLSVAKRTRKMLTVTMSHSLKQLNCLVLNQLIG